MIKTFLEGFRLFLLMVPTGKKLSHPLENFIMNKENFRENMKELDVRKNIFLQFSRFWIIKRLYFQHFSKMLKKKSKKRI